MKKQFRIFVSSVGMMMDEERNTLRELIWKNGNIPVAMEGFTGNHEQTSIEIVRENLDQTDIIIFVLGFTYGSLVGDALSCKDCPVKKSCDAKKPKTGKCVISYTHFEYLYAKHKGILPYCIIQQDMENAQAFDERLNTFLAKIPHQESEKVKIKETLQSEYFTKREDYKKLITKAKKNWSSFYDSNSSLGIEASITNVFTKIQSRLVTDGENIIGLVDGRQAKQELIEKNRKIAELEKEVGQFSREMFGSIAQAIQSSYLPTTAVTGTCIPFIYDKKENTINTFLVCNAAYSNGKRLMFPGGHAFVNEAASPEAIAILKAKVEAGLDVKPIEVNSNSEASGDFSPQFCVYLPPHFTYLFVQEASAKCYREKNHIYHYDAVYICEVLSIHPDVACSQERVSIKLPNKVLTMVEIKKHLAIAIKQFNQQSRGGTAPSETFGDYIVKMLFDAHKSYVGYLGRYSKEASDGRTT